VLRFKHEAWHILFDSFPVSKVLERFEWFYEIFGTDTMKSRAEIERNNKWIESFESRKRKKRAWDALFFEMTIEQIMREINSVWIDPDYELVLTTRQISRIVIGTR
jgi:hypothetical protein